jgi:isopenicillin-N epimerase
MVVEAIAAALNGRTKLLVIDHITARTALLFPVAAIVSACHDRGVPVLVDGAHAPGAIALDIPALGADWYVANLHKWAYSPRPCGVLWAAPGRQEFLHPPVTSWGHGRGYLHEFEHVATNDPTAYLAAPEGIALMREWGLSAILAYNHQLAWDAGKSLTQRWGTTLDTPREMIGAMVTVALPDAAGSTDDDASSLRVALLEDDRIEVQLHAWRSRLWVRVSAQVYNDMTDIERLAAAVERRLRTDAAS